MVIEMLFVLHFNRNRVPTSVRSATVRPRLWDSFRADTSVATGARAALTNVLSVARKSRKCKLSQLPVSFHMTCVMLVLTRCELKVYQILTNVTVFWLEVFPIILCGVAHKVLSIVFLVVSTKLICKLVNFAYRESVNQISYSSSNFCILRLHCLKSLLHTFVCVYSLC